MIEKKAVKEAKLEAEVKLKAATTQLKHLREKDDSLQELRRRVNDLTGIEAERDRAKDKSVLVVRVSNSMLANHVNMPTNLTVPLPPTNIIVCRGKAAAANYRQALLEKDAVKEAKLAAEVKLKAATTQLKHLREKDDSLQELRRRVNDLTGIEAERDRAQERSVMLAMNSSNSMSKTYWYNEVQGHRPVDFVVPICL